MTLVRRLQMKPIKMMLVQVLRYSLASQATLRQCPLGKYQTASPRPLARLYCEMRQAIASSTRRMMLIKAPVTTGVDRSWLDMAMAMGHPRRTGNPAV